MLGGASPAPGDDADAGIRQNSSEGNKQRPSNHAEVMDRVMNESLKGTPSGSCLVIIHSQYLGKKKNLPCDWILQPRAAVPPESIISASHAAASQMLFRGKARSRSQPLYANEGRHVMI